jgi:hypothetical protein
MERSDANEDGGAFDELIRVVARAPPQALPPSLDQSLINSQFDDSGVHSFLF